MSLITGGDNLSGYQVRSGLRREDGDGRVHLYARALSGASLGIPKVLYFNASNSVAAGGPGYFATVPFATGKASTAAAAGRNFYIGIPNEEIPSNADAWFQIGGPFRGAALVSCSGAGVNFAVRWRDATFACGAAYDILEPDVDCFAVMLSSNVNTGTSHDIYMFGNPVCGCTA
jgi:hypothetical protein